MSDRSYENQYHQASGLNLVIAAIVLWNTVYLSKAVDFWRKSGNSLPEEYISHLLPPIWEHINLTGEYRWNLKQSTSLTELRSLRLE